MATLFHARPYDRFTETKSNLEEKLHRTNQGFNFLGVSFCNRGNEKAGPNTGCFSGQ